MDRWIEQLSTSLAERASRRRVIGRGGRALAAIGAATILGATKPTAVSAYNCGGCGATPAGTSVVLG